MAQNRVGLLRRCHDGWVRDERTQIAACTTLIESRSEGEQDRAIAFFYRGLAHRATAAEKAIADQSEAIRLNPWFADAYAARGWVHADGRRYESAIDDFDAAIRLDSANASAFFGRGMARKAQGSYEVAIKDFDVALRLDPSLRNAYDERHDAYAQLGQSEKGFATNPNMLARSCGMLGKSGAIVEAMTYCQRALAIWADQPNALLMRAEILLKGGQRDLAIADLDRLIRSGPPRYMAPFAFELRGLAHLLAGRFDAATSDFNVALGVKANEPIALYGRGLARQRSGDAVGGAADIAAAKAMDAGIEKRIAAYGLQ
ncbi:MAG: tetratricopeptide repeat protein [Reyranellaceae bacterium]